MTRSEFTSLYPNASESTIARNCDLPGLQNTKPESNPFNVAEAADGGKEKSKAIGGRVRLSIESLRSRLCDVDNLAGGAKFCIDGLRYSGLIRDDSPEHIELVVTQRKVKRGEEGTIVTITPL